MSDMSESRLKEYIDINPKVKLQKGEMYSSVEMEKITVGQKVADANSKAEYTGKSCSKFLPNDTLMARITPCLENGKIAKYESGTAGFGSTEFFVLRAKKKKATADYVYYLSQTHYIRQLAVNSMTGASGRQRADAKYIGNIKWNFPDIEIQRKIADILSAYDNLIENNNKRIKLLEQMTENLYKEWFVRFRFPGYEDMGFENGIPIGWKIKRIKNFGQVITGKTPSTEIPSNYGDKYLFIKTPDMHDNIYVIDSSKKLSERGNDVQKLKKLPRWSIMVSCIGTGGVVSINSKEAHTNQQINSIVVHDKNNIEWLFFVCKNLKTTIEMFGATGSTMTNLSKGKFENLKILEPNLELINKFHMYTHDIFKEIEKLTYSNENLIKQRDMLLPRLMSRKLEV